MEHWKCGYPIIHHSITPLFPLFSLRASVVNNDFAVRRVSDPCSADSADWLDLEESVGNILKENEFSGNEWRAMNMPGNVQLNDEVLDGLRDLDEDAKREVLDFIQFLRIKEDPVFIQYVNHRTREALAAKARGEKFLSLEELQKEYA